MCVNRGEPGNLSPLQACEEGLSFYAEVLAGHTPTGECPECLISLGLLQRLESGSLVAIPPSLAANTVMRPMEEVIERSQRTLAAARTSMHLAEEVYRGSTSANGGLVRVIRDADVISTALASAVRSCRHELLTAQPGGGRPQTLLEKALGGALDALSRGVGQRTIYQHTVRTHGPTLSYVEQISAAGAEVRTLDEVFDRLIVCDRRIAFVPDPAEERRHAALAIEHPGLIRYLVGIFEHSWERAVPLPHTPSDYRPALLVDETRRVVLQLMVSGYTDESIAGRLGMSVRTVATHVRKASELFGSRSRAQLAYLIAKAGIFDEDLPDAE
ncbi:LuxR C-terminal-related transcriptional regulator [Streptomyces sp. P9(2023)]|uniref:helix-turn-helix transcriptional regulator n=1 Tax=Streptomyces sp. P9(2023) TaxID=3064394 RepID=UPI0028F45E83|nr:LuxR C-terminal-related transcriptional regulator [Streptomyces sp. P9(2023)]MDT9692490.1 LuxR C-terminal-related transcriptional regulator [Streptomyces sp. P9(2023)]